MLCHVLENFDTVHVLAEAFLGSPDWCREYPLSTIYQTELLGRLGIKAPILPNSLARSCA